MKRIAAAFLGLVLLASAPSAFAAEWNGKITKKDGKFWFIAGKNTYSIANPDKATAFEGQSVKVNGAADQATQTVTIKTIAKA